MGEPDIQANSDQLLQSLDQDFESLQRHFADQLAQDIVYLKAEKLKLQTAITALRQDYDDLLARHQSLQRASEATLTAQQMAQQQLWAKRLAQLLAKNLQDDLHAYVLNAADRELPNPALTWLSSLDETLSHTVQSLERDLTSYQNAMAQQLTRMQAMERQGEVLLESLVSRLSQQLQIQGAHLQSTSLPPGARYSAADAHGGLHNGPLLESENAYLERPRPGAAELPLEPARRLMPPYSGKTMALAGAKSQPRADRGQQRSGAPLTRSPQARAQALQQGWVIGAIATLLFAVQFIWVTALSQGGELFSITFSGLEPFGFEFANGLVWGQGLILLPVLLGLGPQFHAGLWSDLGNWRRHPSRWLLGASGVFLFFSQVFLYQAIAQFGPALAVGVLFIYPLLTLPLNWWVKGERPSQLRGVVMVAIAMGAVLLLRPAFNPAVSLPIETGAALLSAIAFGLHLVSANVTPNRQSLISTEVIQVIIITLLSSGCLLGSVLLGASPFRLSPGYLLLGSLSLGVITSATYLLRYSTIRLLGGNRAALWTAVTPLVTGLLVMASCRHQPPLQLIQWSGLILISLGGITLGWDRLKKATINR